MPTPDPNLMIEYWRMVLPGLLTDACDVEPDLARLIGGDVLSRPEAFAVLPHADPTRRRVGTPR